MKRLPKVLLLGILGIVFTGYFVVKNFAPTSNLVAKPASLFASFPVEEFNNVLTKTFSTSGFLPLEVNIGKKSYIVEYSFDQNLESYIKQLMKTYESDYTAIVVMDNKTGDVLAAVDYDKSSSEYSRKIAFSTSNPAASIFKVVTAADLVENSGITGQSSFFYRGRPTTLYKGQLKQIEESYGKKVNFAKAFASSNNVVFAKAAMQNSTSLGLVMMAEKFGFNTSLFQEFTSGVSKFQMANSDYNMAEFASGFNTDTMISPVHGAVIASIISKNGSIMMPKIVRSVREKDSGKIVWLPKTREFPVISKKSAAELSEMMKLTVLEGTAKRSFRKGARKMLNEIEVGGKTGSITGGIPYGKRDWFVSYAKEKNNASDSGISVCVMIVNVRKWYVRSSFLAKEVIEYYYQNNPSKNITMR